ncbi:MAG: S-layer homology domain-containing protein [Clostridia bacterium]|nr:S-layer homology domain-containing protein [Clostridia bacterium]
MKQTMKRLLGFCLVIMMMLTLIPANVFAVADLQIVGDAKLFLPSSGAIEVQYEAAQLDGTPITEGVTWSLVDDGRVKTYAKIDAATGKVTVNAVALGESFKIKATVGSDSAEFEIKTNSISYSTDFEDETIGSAVTNSIFSTKTATVVANGTGKAASSSYSKWGDTIDEYGLIFTMEDFDIPNYTIEANVGSTGSTTLVAIKHNDAAGMTKFFTEATDGKRNLCYKGNATSWGADLRGGNFNYADGEYFPLKITVTDYYKAKASWNTTSLNDVYLWGHNNTSTEAAYTEVDKIVFGSLIDDLEIYNGTKVAAFVGEGTYPPAPAEPDIKVVGDAKLFLPSDGAIEVAYAATKLNGTPITEGVTWSLVDDGRVKSYAKIDAATGVLTVNAVALGETFKIKATDASGSAEFQITTNSVSYSSDFENEVVGQTVANPIFAGTTAKTITEGQMKSVYNFEAEDTAKTNKIGHGHHKVTNDANELTVYPNNMKSEKITVEATVAVHKQSDFGTSVWWPAMNYPIVVTFGSGSFTVNLANNKVETRVGGTWKANAGLTGYGADFYYQMIPLKVVIEDNKTVSVTANSHTSSVVVAENNTAETGITSIGFESFVDNINIYSGTKVAAFVGEGTYTPAATPTPAPTPTPTPVPTASPTATAAPTASATPVATPSAAPTPAPALAIVGDDVILPVERENGIMRVPYKLNDNAITDVVWSVVAVEGAVLPDGVEIREDGGLLLTGNKVKDKKFIIQAKNTAGEVLAEKEVRGIRTASGNASSDFYYWTDYTAHGFKMDFEMYETGTNNLTRRMFGQAGWDDYLVQPASYQATQAGYEGNAGIVKVKADGNKYVSAFGQKAWGATGAGLGITLSATRYAGQSGIGGSWLDSGYASIATVEADFMIESVTLNKMTNDNEFSLFYQSDAGINLSYKKVSANEAVIYNCSNNGRTELMKVPADTWFNMRIEKNNVAGTIDIYVDNKLMVNDFACSGGSVISFRVGAAIDNIYAYAGSLQAPTLPDSLPEALYYTASRQQAVINVDNNVYLGIYPFPDKVSYFGVGVTAQGNKLYVPYGISNVTITSEDSLYGLNRVATISRSTITEGFDEGTSKTLPNMTGDLLITFTADGPFSVTLTTAGGSKVISTTEDPAEAKKVMIAANTKTGTYKAIFNEKLIGEGVLSSGALTGISVTGGNPDALVVSSMNVTEPYALSPAIAGVAAVGQELKADYTYYSPWQGAKTGSTITWYVAPTADGTYVQAGTGETWVPQQSHAGQYAKYTITVTDGKKTSSLVESAPVLIKDVYSVSLSGNTLTAEVQNVLSDADIYVAAALYNNGDLQKTVVEKISFSGSSYTWTTDASGCDAAKVSLFAASDLKPVAPYKTAGTVPSEIVSESVTETEIYARDGKLYLYGAANTMATVLFYGHGTDGSDVTVAYSDVYERTAGLSEAGKLAYATIVELDGTGHAVISLPTLSDGSYRLDFIPRSGEAVEYLFMMDPQAALTSTVMNLPGFVNVLKLYSDKADSEVETIYSLYLSLSAGGKANVERLLVGAGYEVREFDLAACLIRYFENESFDQTQFNRLKAELNARSLDVAGVTLMQYDALPNKTGAVILVKPWTNFEDLLPQVYDTALLYGVYHVRNVMEADSFLKELTDTNYPNSAYKADICNLVGGKLYSTMAELKAAINGYVPTPGMGGSTISGNGVGSVSGGTVGGGAPMVQAGVAPTVGASVFNDVAPDHWADEAISYLNSINVLSGRPDGSFGPEDSITRAEFVKIICVAFELKSAERAAFGDVPPTAWYASYAAIAGGLGIVQGSEGNFNPDAQITREDAAVMLHRVLEFLGEEFPEEGAGVVDQDSISEYAQQAVAQLQAIGLINGMEDGKYYPKNTMTRAQCAQVITNALRR